MTVVLQGSVELLICSFLRRVSDIELLKHIQKILWDFLDACNL